MSQEVLSTTVYISSSPHPKIQHSPHIKQMSKLELKSEAMNVNNEAFLRAVCIAGHQNFTNFMSTALELDLFDIISKSSKPLTASEIASYLPEYNPEKTPATLDRMLFLLATYSLLDCTTKSDGGQSKVQRYYSLSETGTYFVKGRKGGSMVPFFLLEHFDPMLLNIRHKLTDAVTKGEMNPCEASYGLPFYQALAQHPESSKLFNSALSQLTNITMELLVENYKGFNGIEILVDVGGGNGACLKSIISAHRHILISRASILICLKS